MSEAYLVIECARAAWALIGELNDQQGLEPKVLFKIGRRNSGDNQASIASEAKGTLLGPALALQLRSYVLLGAVLLAGLFVMAMGALRVIPGYVIPIAPWAATLAMFPIMRSLLIGRRLRMKAVDRSKNYVLYLRPFDLDGVGPLPWRMPARPATFEELFQAMLGHVGQLVTVSAPREEIPELGARRIRLAQEWLAEVTTLINGASFCIVAVDPRPGSVWTEVDRVRRVLDRVVFFFPDSILLPRVPDRRVTLEAIRRKLSEHLGIALPPLGARALFLRVDGDRVFVGRRHSVSLLAWWLMGGGSNVLQPGFRDALQGLPIAPRYAGGSLAVGLAITVFLQAFILWNLVATWLFAFYDGSPNSIPMLAIMKALGLMPDTPE